MSRIVDIEPLLHKYDRMNEGTEFSPIHFINDLMALELQPCEDCISLNKLDDIITKAIDESENQTECQTLRWVLDVMSELPSVTPQQKWIPCSERLPEKFGGNYLVTIEYKGEVEGIDLATYIPGGYIDGLWDTDCDWIEGPSEYWHVTAWMPLPEPYKEGEE